MKKYLLLCLILIGCSGIEKSENQHLRMKNAKGEYISRHSESYVYTIETPKKRTRDSYPWEVGKAKDLSKITKDFFRCKGSVLNPPYHDNVVDKTHYDCEGQEKHSLPIVQGKEGVYPVLIEILNYLQVKTQKKVVITCGHRCPAHNTYADRSKANRVSKHMIGAEVDFYVSGMENSPDKIVDLIMQFYMENARYHNLIHYQNFSRFDGKTNVSTKPWYNKEIFIKLFKKNEGRDFDNRHPYPYVSIQVRFDRELDERVVYSWERANGLHLRF